MPAGIYQGRVLFFTKPSTVGTIRMRVLFEGGSYLRKYGKHFLRGWLLVLDLKEGLVECATVSYCGHTKLKPFGVLTTSNVVTSVMSLLILKWQCHCTRTPNGFDLIQF